MDEITAIRRLKAGDFQRANQFDENRPFEPYLMRLP
jgi:hypothetical protein